MQLRARALNGCIKVQLQSREAIAKCGWNFRGNIIRSTFMYEATLICKWVFSAPACLERYGGEFSCIWQLSCRTSWEHRTRTRRRSLPLVKLCSEFLRKLRDWALCVKNVIVTRISYICAACFSDVGFRFSYRIISSLCDLSLSICAVTFTEVWIITFSS